VVNHKDAVVVGMDQGTRPVMTSLDIDEFQESREEEKKSTGAGLEY
jgi:hypothetical protein